MRGLLSTKTKRAWRTAFACALASCGLARSDEPTPSAPASHTPAPPDLSSIYRDAYMNPSVVAPPPGAVAGAVGHEGAGRPLGGVWTNPKRWKYYAGVDYLRWFRPQVEAGNQPLTSTSRNLFWDDPEQQTQGALNADLGPASPRAIGTPGVALFPARLFPINLTPERLTPNDPEARANVDEFLIPGETRLSSSQFDVTEARSGYRPKIGVEFENGDRFDISYFRVENGDNGLLVDNAAGAAFLTKQISSARVNPGGAFDAPLDAAGFARFGMFRFGYIDAGFSLTQGNLTDLEFQRFRGEDTRGFSPVSLFPHFPWNEVPQPTIQNDPGSPLLPLLGTPDALPIQDSRGIRSGDIPREPTTNDYPDQSFLFQDGELAVATFRSELQGGEAVYRRKMREWNRSWYDLDLLFAFKMVRFDERFTFFFADLYNFSRTTANGPVAPLAGNTATPNIPQPPLFIPNDSPLDPVDQRGQAAEDTQISIDRGTKNTFFGPQIGVDVRIPFRSVFEVQLASKVGWVLNAASTNGLIARGDGLLFSDYSKSELMTGGIWDGQLGLVYLPHPNVKIAGGWEWMNLIRYAGAVHNQALDLSTENRPRASGNILWNGWYAGVELKY
jgi:hypothetical protein